MKKWQGKHPDKNLEELVDLIIQDKQFKINFSPQTLKQPSQNSEKSPTLKVKVESESQFPQETQQQVKKSQVHSFNPKIMVSQKSLQNKANHTKQSLMINNNLKQFTMNDNKDNLKITTFSNGNDMQTNKQVNADNGTLNDIFDSYNQPFIGNSFDEVDIFY